jgi:hypothetical protein
MIIRDVEGEEEEERREIGPRKLERGYIANEKMKAIARIPMDWSLIPSNSSLVKVRVLFHRCKPTGMGCKEF